MEHPVLYQDIMLKVLHHEIIRHQFFQIFIHLSIQGGQKIGVLFRVPVNIFCQEIKSCNLKSILHIIEMYVSLAQVQSLHDDQLIIRKEQIHLE